MSNMDIVTEARGWLGVRWLHQGRTREGVDCAGLVIGVAKACRNSTFDTSDYARQATDETMLALCRELLQPVEKADLQPGDVLVMAFENQRHIGIVGDYPYPGELSLIHAYALSPHRVVEVRLDSVWMSRVIGCFRFPEVM
jgi:cell wall-associated NlpC family hydrolase